ncbi:MAG: four helix bundle protein [Nitrospinae bacterium]|nr:four helix bundle protein [Nitrospinota bacterium]
MSSIERFEDIEAWRKARELNRLIYKVTSEGKFAKDFALRDQMRRASISIMSNIAEGFDRGGNKEFRQFLSIAKGSASEIKSQLYAALDAGFLEENQFQKIYDLVVDTSRLLGGFLKYLKKSDLKGTKFKEKP